MIIPNKSTIAEEEIEVPYGRQVRDSGSTAIDDRERSHEHDTDGEHDRISPGIGLSGLSARFKQDDDESAGGARSGSTAGDDYFDKMSFGRASVASDRSTSKMAGDDEDRLRRDYEYKIATMQNRIATLERDLENADDARKRAADGESRVRRMEEELMEFRKVNSGFFLFPVGDRVDFDCFV
jgi:protein SPA2